MFGEVTTITKLGAAVAQLECAINLFLKEAYIPAITLAGASEDIVRNCIDPSEGSYKKMHNYLTQELGFSGDDAKQDIVGARNWIKHWDQSLRPKHGERDHSDAVINLKKESLTAILKAASNFQHLESFEFNKRLPSMEYFIPVVEEYLSTLEK